jgi:hypothetical protein
MISIQIEKDPEEVNDGKMQIEEVDALKGTNFPDRWLKPYLKNIFKDLQWRQEPNESLERDNISLYTFKHVGLFLVV